MKNNLLVLLILFCIAPSLESTAQNTQEESIKKVISIFFQGMKEGNTDKITNQIYPECSLQTVAISTEGKGQLQSQKMSDFIMAISRKPTDVIYDEKILSYDIKIDGRMAIAWTPYHFYLNNTFIHCGVNVFSLIKDNEQQWKIFSISDTRRKDGCD